LQRSALSWTRHTRSFSIHRGSSFLPFVTIEDVDVVYVDHMVVANDNDLPSSAGRRPNVQDDNELILLRVPEFLRAR